MNLFEECNVDLDNVSRNAGIKAITKLGGHNRDDYFFSTKEYLQPGGHVTFLDRFQSAEDAQNDLKSIFIKPLSCVFLTGYHYANWQFQFGCAAIHLLTGSPIVAWEHLKKSATSFAKMCFFDLVTVGAFLVEALSFVCRTLLTLAYGAQLATISTIDYFQVNDEEVDEVQALPLGLG